jgi:hypothetical protein
MRLGWRALHVVLPVGLAGAILLGGIGAILRAGQGDVSADRVLGQINFTNIAPNFVDATGLNAAGVTIDRAAGHALVADTANNRVLGWKSVAAFATGGAADVVIGQADFNSSGCNQNGATANAASLAPRMDRQIPVSGCSEYRRRNTTG